MTSIEAERGVTLMARPAPGTAVQNKSVCVHSITTQTAISGRSDVAMGDSHIVTVSPAIVLAQFEKRTILADVKQQSARAKTYRADGRLIFSPIARTGNAKAASLGSMERCFTVPGTSLHFTSPARAHSSFLPTLRNLTAPRTKRIVRSTM